ncbi:hypothetical protein [Candidatus Poriferisocius sp.]|uniref:hypothetical protein n=1 Tax=Candidatus Poriferisocius sp. TaxID=3101276 RepID=UPI003B01155A
MISVVALGAVCELKQSTGWDSRLTGVDEELDTSNAKPDVFRPATPTQHKIKTGRHKPMVLIFSLEEFPDLSDGRRITLKADRGFSEGPWRLAVKVGKWRTLSLPLARSPRVMWWFTSRAKLAREVIAVLEPDDELEHFDWIVNRLSYLGIEVDRASITTAPFRVEFGPTVLSKLRK